VHRVQVEEGLLALDYYIFPMNRPDRWGDCGDYVAGVDFHTDRSITDDWNSEERVNLSFLSNDDYCRAVISLTGETPVSNDFLVCGHKEVGNYGCIDKGHEGDSVLRLDCGSKDFLIVIQRPGLGMNDSVAFSRPGLRAGEFVRFLGSGHESRWDTLVCCHQQPRVWKVLFEHFGCCQMDSGDGVNGKRDHPPPHANARRT
jgi:hypothetical protein